MVKTKANDVKEDKFAVDESSKKKTKVWPIITLLAITFVFALLGYVKWEENFGIKVFNNFHTWLTGLTIGKHTVVSYVLGKVTALGTWEIISMVFVLFAVTIISAVIYKLSIDEVIDGAIDGVTKMVKPVIVMALAYSIFVIIYWSPIVPTMIHGLLKAKFSVLPTALSAFISSVFTPDFGYTGYTIGQSMAAAYTKNVGDVLVIYPVMHGFVQMLAPTSVILLAGLSYSNVSYKDWIKYIWKFAVVLLVALLIIFIV